MIAAQLEAVAPLPTLDQHLVELHAVVLRLIELVETENRLLETERPSSIMPLLDEKGRLSAILAKGLATIKKDPVALSTADASAREALTSALAHFQDLVLVNGRIVMRLQSISEGILGAIAHEVNKGKTLGPTYGPNPTMTPPIKSMPAASLAVNAVI